jgi:hypothetical protein
MIPRSASISSTLRKLNTNQGKCQIAYGMLSDGKRYQLADTLLILFGYGGR